jgi:hypothetical protein
MKGVRRTLWTPACLACGWQGGDGTRVEAEAEARMHERGERMPWQRLPGEASEWAPGAPNGRLVD